MNQLQLVSLALNTNTPVVLVGPPGVGKTATINALAESAGAHLEVVIASLRDPTDFGGLPIKAVEMTPDGKEVPSVYLAPPKWARNLKDALDESKPAWLFIDEISTAPPAVQAALLRVVLDCTVGELAIGQELRRIAAMNPPDQAAGGWDIAPPLANRFFWIQWNLDPEAWAQAIVSGFPAPVFPRVSEQHIAANEPKYRALISEFIRRRPELMIQVPKDESKASGPWPSPRTWTMASRLLAGSEALFGENMEYEGMVLRGSVGDGPASEFLTWRQSFDLPNPRDILKNPSGFKPEEFKDRPDLLSVILGSLVSLALQPEERSEQTIETVWEIINKVAVNAAPDMAAGAAFTLLKQAAPKNPAVLKPFVKLYKDAQLLA
jgi:DNA polymerase III delta prime subunit